MNKDTIASLAPMANINGYSDSAAAVKRSFHSLGRKLLKDLANDLGLTPGSYEIRSNLGGIAVCGEVTLHSDNLYVQLSDNMGAGARVLYRTCKSRRDYCGGMNHWMSISRMAVAEESFVGHCRALMQSSALAKPAQGPAAR
jgi:hypothetical protein